MIRDDQDWHVTVKIENVIDLHHYIFDLAKFLKFWKWAFFFSDFVQIGFKWKVATSTVSEAKPLPSNADILENIAKRRKNKQKQKIYETPETEYKIPQSSKPLDEMSKAPKTF